MTCLILAPFPRPIHFGASKIRDSGGTDTSSETSRAKCSHILAVHHIVGDAGIVGDFVNAEARRQVESVPVHGGHHARLETHALHELAGLKLGLGAALQAEAAIERKPYRQLPDLVLALGELRFRQLAKHDLIVGGGALKVDVALRHEVESVIGPVLGDVAHRMRFRRDGLVEGLGKLLPEKEGRQILQVAARLPSLAQVRLPFHR